MDEELINGIIDFSKDFLRHYVPAIVSYCVTNKAISTYRLHKNFHPQDISNVSVPEELKQKYTDVEINQIGSKRVRKAVLEFAEVLEKNFPKEALINFYNNINEVKIRRNYGIMLLSASGTYLCPKNRIAYTEFSSIFHELFHMASAVYNSETKMGYTGFSQTRFTIKGAIDDAKIGDGINEGYTELLTHRYFGEKHKMPKTYKKEVSIVETLEKIVGQEEMEKLYLSANLMGLIDNLKQYASEKEVLNFIFGVDFIREHSSDLFLFKNDKMQKSVTNVYEFLKKAYTTKLEKQVKDGSLTIDEFKEQKAKFIESLGTSIKIGIHKYKYLTASSMLDELEKDNHTQNVDIGELHRKN